MKLPVLAFAVFCAAGSLGAQAQDLTDDELLELFNAQRDAFEAAKKSGVGKTRGLTLVTVDTAVAPGAPTTEMSSTLDAPALDGTTTTTIGQTDTATVVGTAPTAPTTTTTAEAKPLVQPVVFGKLDQDKQVNVKIKFAFDSAALSPDQKPKLAQLCSVMQRSDINLFRIVGHTDAKGSDEYNEKLSLLRAEEVKRYFISECGIASTRLQAIGLGERFPFDESDPNAGENRRVEFQALS